MAGENAKRHPHQARGIFAGYKADHWCKKGHVLYCFDGEMQTELEDGRVMKLTNGMCYFVGDKNEAHRSSTLTSCRLFIVD